MDADSADNVRRLSQYENDTAGGLMMAECFHFLETETVGKFLRGLASDEGDFERYRGQLPYIVNDLGELVGVVFLRGLLTARHQLSERQPQIVTGWIDFVGLPDL